MKRFHIYLLILFVQAVLFSGCSRNVAWLDAKDRGEALVSAAMARNREGNIDAALKLYSEAIDRDPKIAVAHLDMGLIFHDNKKDYLRAIYHYERYLELRPDAEKRKVIEDRIRLAGQAYMARFASDGTAAAEIGRISAALNEAKRENDSLRNTIRQINLRSEQAKFKSSDRSKTVVAIEDDAPADLSDVSRRSDAGARDLNVTNRRLALAQTAPRYYQVRRGDTLTSIAMAMYKNSDKSDFILKANKDKLASAKDLKVGQVLAIP